MLTDLQCIEMRNVLLAVTAMVALAGCETGESASPPTPVDQRRAVIERETAQARPTPPVVKKERAVLGEVPSPIMDLFIDDLMLRALVKRNAISVREAAEILWADGWMGCRGPDTTATQAVIPGYRVKLEANAQIYQYHSDRRGHFILCDGGLPLQPAKRGARDEVR